MTTEIDISTAKSRKPRKTKTDDFACIVGGDIYFEDVKQMSMPIYQDESRDSDDWQQFMDDRNIKSIRVKSLYTDWNQREWLGYDTLLVSALLVEMTLRQEVRANRVYWYAYRRVGGKLHKRFVGQSSELCQKKIVEIAQKMPSL